MVGMNLFNPFLDKFILQFTKRAMTVKSRLPNVYVAVNLQPKLFWVLADNLLIQLSLLAKLISVHESPLTNSVEYQPIVDILFILPFECSKRAEMKKDHPEIQMLPNNMDLVVCPS
jgi:hypothetical protein